MQRLGDFKYYEGLPIDTVASDLLINIAIRVFRDVEIPSDMKAGKNLQKVRPVLIPRRCLGKLVYAKYKTELMMYGFTTVVVDTKGSGETLTKHIIGVNGCTFPKNLNTTKIMYCDPEGSFRVRFNLNTLLVFYNHYLQQVYYGAEGTLRYEDVSPSVGVWVDANTTKVDLFELLEKFYVQQGEYQATISLYGDKYRCKQESFHWVDEKEREIPNGILSGPIEDHAQKVFVLRNGVREVYKLKVMVRYSVSVVTHRFVGGHPKAAVYINDSKAYRDFSYIGYARAMFPRLALDSLDYLTNDEIKLVRYQLPTRDKLLRAIDVFRGTVIDIPPIAVRYVGLDTKLNTLIVTSTNIVDELAALQNAWESIEQEVSELADDPPLAYHTLWNGIAKAVGATLSAYLTKTYFSCMDIERVDMNRYGTYFAPGLYVYTAYKRDRRELPCYSSRPTVTYVDYALDMHKGRSLYEDNIEEEDVCVISYFGDKPPMQPSKLSVDERSMREEMKKSEVTLGEMEQATIVFWDERSSNYTYKCVHRSDSAKILIEIGRTTVTASWSGDRITAGTIELYVTRHLPILYVPQTQDTFYKHVEIRKYYQIRA